MKNRFFLVLLLFVSLFLSACKDDDNPADNGGSAGDTGNYFPVTIGTYYKYNLETQDSNGTTINALRSSTYTGTVNVGGTNYTEQTDTVASTGTSNSAKSYFRKTDSGAFYFLDTTGLGEALPSDSLLRYISFSNELRYLTFPLAVNSAWPVFKMTLNYIINLDLVEVNAVVTGKENITLNLSTGPETKEALKIKYTLTLRIPNLNTLQIITSNYEANSWVVQNIGIVRMEGNATILGAFGGNIDLGDSTRTVTQDIIQYNIK